MCVNWAYLEQFGAVFIQFEGSAHNGHQNGMFYVWELPAPAYLDSQTFSDKQYLEESLKRLGVATIDLYYVNYIAPDALIEATASFLAGLVN
jgi:hypothetical protein